MTNIPAAGGIPGVPGSHHAQFIDVLHPCPVHRRAAPQDAVVEDGVRTAKSMGLRNLPKTWLVNCGWVLAANLAAWPPGVGYSTCTTARTSKTPSRTRCREAPALEPARPAGPPRPRPRAEDQPHLALEEAFLACWQRLRTLPAPA